MSNFSLSPVSVAGDAAAGSMFGPIGTLAGGIIGAGAGLLGDSMQAGSSAASVQQQEQYATSMADTQYQRSVADMKAAGLNPLAMFSGGSGLDAAPSGSVAQPGPYSNAGSLISTGIGSAVSAENQFYSMQNQAQQIRNMSAQEKQTQANTTATLAAIPGINSSNALKVADAQLAQLQSQRLGQQVSAETSLGKPYRIAQALGLEGSAPGAIGSAASTLGGYAAGAGLSGSSALGDVADLMGAL